MDLKVDGTVQSRLQTGQTKQRAVPWFVLQVFTEAFRLKQVGLLHADVSAPGQEVGSVVACEEGAWRGIPLAGHLPCGKQLSWGKKSSLSHSGP